MEVGLWEWGVAIPVPVRITLLGFSAEPFSITSARLGPAHQCVLQFNKHCRYKNCLPFDVEALVLLQLT